MNKQSNWFRMALLGASVSLAACGGGGGGGNDGADNGGTDNSGGSSQSLRVVFLADKDTDNVFELFLSDDLGLTSNHIKLSAPFAHDNASIEEYKLSPDGRWLAYVADAAFDDRYELFIAPVDGSAPATRAHAPLTSSENVSDSGDFYFEWSADSSRLAFAADLDAADPSGDTNDGTHDLYTVTPGSDTPVRVSGRFGNSGGSVSLITWAPNGSRIAYIADADRSGVNEAFTVAPDSQGSIKVNSALQTNGDVRVLAWSPDSTTLAYVADQNTDNENELFTAGPAATGGTQVSAPQGSDRDVLDAIAWAPDSSRIAYLSNDEGGNTSVFELYTTTKDGTDGASGGAFSGVIKEHASLATGRRVFEFAWAPDASRIAYRATQDSSSSELYTTVPGPAPANTRVSGNLTGGGNVDTNNFRWSPMSNWIAYVADQQTDNVFELWVSTPDGTQNFKMSGAMTSGGDVSTGDDAIEWSPDGSRIAYLADQNDNGTNQLFTSTPGADNNNTVVSGRPTPGGNVTNDFGWSADGQRLVYRATQDQPNVFEIYSTRGDADPTQTGDNPQLSGALAVNASTGETVGDVTDFELEGTLD